MNFTYNYKEYTILNINGKWRVYSSDPTFTKKEGIEILNYLEKLNEKDFKEIPNYIENFYLRKKYKIS